MGSAVEFLEEQRRESPIIGRTYYAHCRLGRFEAYVTVIADTPRAEGLVEVCMMKAPNMVWLHPAEAFRDLPAALASYHGAEMRTIIQAAHDRSEEVTP